MNTLGGTLFAFNAISQDYCVDAAIQSLIALCDKVVLLDAGSTDSTAELMKGYESENTKVICLQKDEWNKQIGREKLAYFTNIAIGSLDTDWQFNLQSDEVIHEYCFDAIREAIAQPHTEGYWVKRINLFGDSQHYLDVDVSRIPVGEQIIRLCKTNYISVGDAQSIHCPEAKMDYLEKIRIYHCGFVRNKFVHPKKIKHMLEEVFLMGNDQRVEDMGNEFDTWGVGFTPEDCKPITEPLPIFVQKWAEETDKVNNVKF